MELIRRDEASHDTARVLFAHGTPVFRAGLRTLLTRVADLAVAGEVHDGHNAARRVRELRPDVVVLTLESPGAAALAAIRRIASATSGARVLVLASDPGLFSLVDAVRAGARGLVLSSAGEDDIIRAIRSVARGDATFGSDLADHVLTHIATAEPPVAASVSKLTDRERDVPALLGRGDSTGQIALALGLSAKTVRNHISSICTKLGVLDRTQAALHAREAGLSHVG
jgi:DNA-binding NarL/FixJ family response regulator